MVNDTVKRLTIADHMKPICGIEVDRAIEERLLVAIHLKKMTTSSWL